MCARTDADAFAIFYRRHVRAVYGYLRRRSPSAEVDYRVQPQRPRLTGTLAYPGYPVGSARVAVR